MLDVASILVFAGALFVAAASPGPGIAAIVARVLGRGPEGAIAFTTGVAAGDVVWLTLAVGGLAVLASTFHGVFVAIRFAGALYLAFLAWKLWTTPVDAVEDAAPPLRESPVRLFLTGLAITLGNPKVVVFYLALLPSLVDLADLGLAGYAELVAVTQIVLGTVFAGYIVLAVKARRLFTSPRAMRFVNRGTGVVMAGAALAVATR